MGFGKHVLTPIVCSTQTREGNPRVISHDYIIEWQRHVAWYSRIKNQECKASGSPIEVYG